MQTRVRTSDNFCVFYLKVIPGGILRDMFLCENGTQRTKARQVYL